MRCGASKKIIVLSSNRRVSRWVSRAPELRGRKPSNVKRSVARPESASAIVGALGPGMTTMSMPSAIASRVSRNPGSLIVGIPASDTTRTFFPLCRSARTSSVRAVSFPSKNEITLAVNVTPRSAASR